MYDNSPDADYFRCFDSPQNRVFQHASTDSTAFKSVVHAQSSDYDNWYIGGCITA